MMARTRGLRVEQSLVARIVGPYGLNAVLAVFVLFFLGFLYLFNFTSFF
jgi:hypothetical protein